MAAKIIAESVRSSLGPKGMDKMLVDGFGDVTITNDGATILDEMEVQHPAAKMMVEVAKTQDDEVGDGTTTSVVVAGELLKKAEDLIDQGLHPTVIVDGYRAASSKALEILDQIAIKVDPTDKATLRKVATAGANVLLCEKGIDDVAQHYLAKKGVLAVRRVKQSDMEKLVKATGARIVSNLDDLKAGDLGKAQLVEERKIADDKMTFVEGARNPKAVTILVRGGSERLVDEAERSIHDALCVVRDVVRDPRVVGGGGAPEAEMAKQLRGYAQKQSGKEQLAILAFADALESVPIALAENAGLDPIDIMVQLRAAHDKGQTWAGVDVFDSKVADLREKGVLEPHGVKMQVIKSAAEAAGMILKIDDVIASAKSKDSAGPPKGQEEGGEEGSSEY